MNKISWFRYRKVMRLKGSIRCNIVHVNQHFKSQIVTDTTSEVGSGMW